MIKALVIVACLMLCMTVEVFAGGNPHAKVAVHVLPYDCQRACTRKFPAIYDVSDIESTYGGCGDIDFFPVFFNLVAYQGLEYGVVWPGGYSCVYTSCSSSHLGEIVWSGDGTSQIYGECREGSIAVAGWGWITVDEPGNVCVVRHPATGAIITADCNPHCARLDTVTMSYCAGVCGGQGWKFVDQATVPTTWGSIKGIFR